MIIVYICNMKIDELYVTFNSNEKEIMSIEKTEMKANVNTSEAVRTSCGQKDIAEKIFLTMTLEEAIEKIKEDSYSDGLFTERPGEEY